MEKTRRQKMLGVVTKGSGKARVKAKVEAGNGREELQRIAKGRVCVAAEN